MPESFTPPSIVVGIDGSPDAVRAALWAVPEALSRDIALRLVSVAADSVVNEAATAEAQRDLNAALAAVRTADGAVRVETAVLTGEPVAALLAASRDAAMLCVGAVGSTAGALAAGAHCPVAAVRGADRPDPGWVAPGWVAVELDGTPDSAAVLQFAVEEARLRGVPLRALGAWQSRKTSICDSNQAAESDRLVRAQIDRRLSEWQRHYPDLDVRPVAVHGRMFDYLVRNAAKIQLVVVGAGNADAGELLGRAGLSALHDTDCSVLVVDRQRLL